MKNSCLYLTLLTILGFHGESQAQQQHAGNAPRLVVSIAIDQLRSDYLEAFTPLYSQDGFKRLLARGLVYTNASYSFAPVDRASAIAALSTGVPPYYNNIVGQRWLNRETLRPVWCVDDPKSPGLLTSETASPVHLSTSTLGDELMVATDGRAKVYAIAPYRDAAVLSAGHAANGALWIDDRNGEWCTSQYYYTNYPTWVRAWNDLQAPCRKMGDITWEPVNPLVGNFSYFVQAGQQKPFKHRFSGANATSQYKASAMVNTDVTEMALQCMASTGIGNDRVSDLLCLTYYAGNFDHQPVTDCQIELQDIYVRLDHELARLIDAVEQKLGHDNVLFVVTSTGYSDEESADYDKFRIPTGTFYMSRTANLLNMYFGAVYGQGKYVETTFRNQIFLNHQLLEQKKISLTDATQRGQEFLALFSGVRNAYTSLQLLTSQNEQLKKTRNAFSAEHCGDLIVEVAPGWRILNEDTQENELSRASYTPFPIIIYGGDIKAERISLPVTTDRIAPTIARAIRIRAPNACSAEPLF